MPELAEVRLMGDFINSISAGRKVVGFTMREGYHLKEPSMNDVPFDIARIHALTRGKELLIRFWNPAVKNEAALSFTMGMSGYFIHQHKDSTPKKHIHLQLNFDDDTYLGFVDTRRFGKWKWCDGFNPGRGADILDAYDRFLIVIQRLAMKPVLPRKTSMSEVMMNQEYFNGIGNYLRAEILAKFHVNPFLPYQEYLDEVGIERFVQMIDTVVRFAYTSGGGRIQIWKNPMQPKQEMKSIFECYKKPGNASIVDRTNRRFWFPMKWLPAALKKYEDTARIQTISKL